MKRSRYHVIREVGDGYKEYKYTACVDDKCAGYIKGYAKTKDTIDMQDMMLLDEFKGNKAVRIMKETIKIIHKDFYRIVGRGRNDKNNGIRLMLGLGFNIIGTVLDGNNLYVELMREDK